MQITLEGHPDPVQSGHTVLVSLLRARIAFPFSRQAGKCGTCQCKLVFGYGRDNTVIRRFFSR